MILKSDTPPRRFFCPDDVPVVPDIPVINSEHLDGQWWRVLFPASTHPEVIRRDLKARVRQVAGFPAQVQTQRTRPQEMIFRVGPPIPYLPTQRLTDPYKAALPLLPR